MTNRSSGFSADVDMLAEHAGRFAGLADRVGQIHTELGRALDDTARCWGSDAVGQSFAESHVEPAQSILDNLASLPDKLSEVGSRLTDTAVGYRATDAEQARNFLAGEV